MGRLSVQKALQSLKEEILWEVKFEGLKTMFLVAMGVMGIKEVRFQMHKISFGPQTLTFHHIAALLARRMHHISFEMPDVETIDFC